MLFMTRSLISTVLFVATFFQGGIHQPAYLNGEWHLFTRPTTGDIESRSLAGTAVDVVEMDISGVPVMVVLGAETGGGYESFVDGAEDPAEIEALLKTASGIDLYVPDEFSVEAGIDWENCVPYGSTFCHLARVVELYGGPVYEDLEYQGQSNVMIQTGMFPASGMEEDYLVWRIRMIAN